MVNGFENRSSLAVAEDLAPPPPLEFFPPEVVLDAASSSPLSKATLTKAEGELFLCGDEELFLCWGEEGFDFFEFFPFLSASASAW